MTLPMEAPDPHSGRLRSSSGDFKIPARASARGSRGTDPGLDCRVLVVEDDEATLEAVTELLEGEGVTVCSARHGEEALARLHEGACPSLIILDLMMPVMDGWELCRRISSEEALAGIPIAIVTAAAAIDRMPVRKVDAGFFSKPVDYRHLLEVVRRYGG